MRARKVRADYRGQVVLPVLDAKTRRALTIEPERSLLARIKQAVSVVGGVHVMRNAKWKGKVSGRWVDAGLEDGSSDLVAIVAPLGRWLCLEVKRAKGGVVDPGQEKWLAKMRAHGAVAGVVRSVEEALALVQEARRPCA